ncbi:YciI family protein [Nocardioides sp. NPDC023903]|uniref:YciI family protein n=1 Tax=Nocardioides sp. NPDC023903 TaxID=3157195 RepID=UPI003408C4F4
MTRYYLLIPNVEAEWQAKSEEDRNALFAVHEKFAALLAERGHTILRGYGAVLAAPSTAVTVRSSGVTDGPYTETAEHLAGLYVVESEDRDDLADCCRLLATVESAIEIRAAE